MQAVTDVALWHWRPGHFNRKILDLLKEQNHNGVSLDGTAPDCHVYAMTKSHQLGHSKTADHNTKQLFQLVFTDLMGSLTP